MDLSQNFQDYASESEDVTKKQKYNSGLAPTMESDNTDGSFECNICFDSAQDPVVTLCGHLYCWACIFEWLHVQSSSSEQVQQQVCPVCKGNISQTSLVPLYCNAPPRTDSELRKPRRDVIPPRPTACGLQTLISAANPHSNQLHPFQSQSPAFHQHFSDPIGNYAAISSSNLVSPTMAGIINPTIGLLGELVYTRMFGSTDANLFTFPLPSSYARVGRDNPRMRRQELQLDKSLNRVSNFLFCCFVLCLLLF